MSSQIISVASFRSLPDHFLLFLFIYSQTKTWTMFIGGSQTISGHLGASQTISGHLRASQTIYHFWPLKPFLAVSVYLLPDHFWPFRSLPDHFLPFLLIYSQTITWIMSGFQTDHFWPFRSLPDHFWLFETSQTISGFKSLPDHFCPFKQLNNTKNKFIS